MTTEEKIKEMISIYDNNINDTVKMHKKFNEAYSIEDCLKLLKEQAELLKSSKRWIESIGFAQQK